MMSFLSKILDLLFPVRATAALVRDATSDDLLGRVRVTEHRVGPYICTTLFSYRDPLIRASILEAKFRGNTKAQELLGSVLREYIDEGAVAVPVPLSRQRRRKRGYNQVEEILTRGGIPYSPLLTRTKDTPPQTEQSGSARKQNVARAFRSEAMDARTTYVIVDDVLTTGATLAAAGEACTALGARDVRLLALAH